MFFCVTDVYDFSACVEFPTSNEADSADFCKQLSAMLISWFWFTVYFISVMDFFFQFVVV